MEMSNMNVVDRFLGLMSSLVHHTGPEGMKLVVFHKFTRIKCQMPPDVSESVVELLVELLVQMDSFKVENGIIRFIGFPDRIPVELRPEDPSPDKIALVRAMLDVLEVL